MRSPFVEDLRVRSRGVWPVIAVLAASACLGFLAWKKQQEHAWLDVLAHCDHAVAHRIEPGPPYRVTSQGAPVPLDFVATLETFLAFPKPTPTGENIGTKLC